MKIVVSGATGFIGKAVCSSLIRAGNTVYALTRDPSKAALQLPSGVRALRWGDGDKSEWQTVCADSDVVIHLAGESVAGHRWTPEYKARLMDSRVETTRSIVDSFTPDRHPSKLISASAVGYYGDTGDNLITESSPIGTDFLATLSEAWEKEADRASQVGVNVVKLRIGIVLGDGGALSKMLYPLPLPISPWKLGLGGPLGSGRQWMPWIHHRDMVNLILWAAENREVSGIYNGTAPNPVRNSDFSYALGRVLHRPAILPIPAFVLRLMLGEFAEALLGGQNAVPKAALAAGFQFEFTEIEEALRNVLN